MRLNRRHPDEGSIIVAVSVIMIVGMLGAAVIARTMSGMSSSRRSQDFAAALGRADVGVSDALFRLDQLGGATPTQFCVGAAACSVTSLPTSADVQYVASPTPGDSLEVVVRSRGVTNSVAHGVQARVRARRLFPFALYGRTSLRFNGSADGTIYTVDTSGARITEPPAIAASGGTITCNGSTSPAQFQGSSGSNNCSNEPTSLAEYNPLPPVLDCSAAKRGNVPAQPCPTTPPTSCLAIAAAGGVSPTQITLAASIPGGAYHCDRSIKFPNGFTVTGTAPAKIFVISPSGSGNLNVDFTGAAVNAAAGANPTRLQVYLAGAGVVDTGNGSNAGSFGGVMYAPGASLTENGCKASWLGAIVVNSATCNGGPSQSIKYDPRVYDLNDGNWKVQYFKEIPSGSVVLP